MRSSAQIGKSTLIVNRNGSVLQFTDQFFFQTISL